MNKTKYIAWNVVERTDYVLGTSSTEYTQQAISDYSRFLTVFAENLWTILHDDGNGVK